MKRLLICVLALALYACAPQAPSDPRIVPTVAPPVWTESAAPIMLDNVARIAYLGRLDSPGEPSTVFDHALSADGTRLAGLDNVQLMVWDLVNGELVYGTARGEATQVFYSPDRTEVYMLDASGQVLAFDVQRGLEQGGFLGHQRFNVTSAYHVFDGWLALGGLDGSVRVWDALERQSLATIEAHTLQVRALAFSDDGRLLATAGEEGQVRVWDWRARQQIASFDTELPAQALRFAPDASQLAVGLRDVIRLYPLDEGGQTLTLNAGVGSTSLLLYAPDGGRLVSGGSEDDFALWDTRSGALAARMPGSGGQRAAAVFAPDSSMLLTSAMGGMVALWNLTTITAQTVNSAVIDTGGMSVFDVDWTSDQRLLTLFGARGSVQVWGIGPE